MVEKNGEDEKSPCSCRESDPCRLTIASGFTDYAGYSRPVLKHHTMKGRACEEDGEEYQGS